ncbi:MAG: alpha/beta hydrolase [Pseudomonadota bacterium]|nr:alpha/beta hydrolase [Pseudomonadota bacterium]
MSRPDPDWLQAQYDNRALVPDHARFFERWARDSAIARERSSRRLDIAYGAGPAETLDLFPSPRGGAPVLVFIHGGWWRAFDKLDFSFIAPAFTREGAMVVVPNHALCPSVSIETIALQLVQALAWIYRNAVLYGGDPRRIVVAGHSAGGHLTAMLLSCVWRSVAPDLPARLVSGGLSISGVFDLEPLRQTPFLQADLRLTAESARRLSPAGFPAPAGPLYAAAGGDESAEFLRHNELICGAWGPAAVPVCETVPDAHHFSVLDDLVDPHGRLHGLALRLLGLAV